MKKSVLILLSTLFIFTSGAFAADKELIVYSARKEHLIKEVFEKYQALTGVKIIYSTGKDAALLQKIVSEGQRTKADILLTVDAGNLWHAAQKDILEPVSSAVLNENIPAQYRDPANRWFGLSLRARTIVYNKDRVTPEELSSYQALADAQWKNRLILRTSKKVYNQSLVAMLIASEGKEKTSDIVKGWVNNLAAPPYSSDTKALEAVAAGQGDVTLVNTYYFGRLLKENPDLPLAIFWPDSGSQGVHVNVSGAGVIKHSKNKEEAIKFLEWLSEKDAQKIFADANMEYPVNQKVDYHPFVKAWGTFNPSAMNLAKAGELQADAIRLMDQTGYK